jgi:hypothetical protein
MNNKSVFNSRKQILELKLGRTYKQLKHYQKEAEIIKYMIQLLRERAEELTIINPYTSSIIDFLGESEFFKRDFDKYNGILKTITAFNSYNRPLFELDGNQILFTTLDDIQLFISILEAYHESISVNISPKAAEILNDIRSNIDNWILERKLSELATFTTNNYFELCKSTLTKRSVQRYFGELNRVGFLKVVGKEGTSNSYQLSDKIPADFIDNLLILKEDQINLIKWELGDAALQFIQEDAASHGLSIMLHDGDVDIPAWEDDDER